MLRQGDWSPTPQSNKRDQDCPNSPDLLNTSSNNREVCAAERQLDPGVSSHRRRWMHGPRAKCAKSMAAHHLADARAVRATRRHRVAF